jgi:acyl-CoA synthetase (AMP-forming)/AMP-acid ligase II/thioesterase domain-containing protein
MIASLSSTKYGSIQDIAHDIRWDRKLVAQQVTRRAELLSKMGIGRGSRVAILHSGSAYFFADLLATWMVGATAAPLDSALTAAELKTITGFAKPAAFLVDRSTPAIDLSIPVVNLDSAPSTASSFTLDFHPDDPALVLFTSGTTGDPKGVVLSFRALFARISSNVAIIGKAALSRTLVTLPTHFGHGLIGNALTPLMMGNEIILPPLGLSLVSDLGRIIDKYSISFMSSVPALWRKVISRGDPPTGRSLTRVHVGSAPLSSQLWSEIAAWASAEVVNCYGLTETANWIAGASSHVEGIAEGLLGRSWGSTIAIKVDNGSIQSTGHGEIVVQSPGLMSGYLNRPDLTSAAVHDGWFHTGDRGSVDDGGQVWLTGRIKEEINRGGMKIQPAEIDLLLERHPAVAEACTFGIPDPISGEVLGAVVRLAKDARANQESLRAWCRDRLRQGAIPDRWFFVDEIPRNARGKVNRDVVRRLYAKESSVSKSNLEVGIVDKLARSTLPDPGASIEPIRKEEYAARGTIAEAVWSAIERSWSEVLPGRPLSANMSWKDADIDSLDTLRLWFRIEELLGQTLSMEAMVSSVTPSELATRIEKMLDASPLAPKQTASTPLVFYMPPADGDFPTLARFRASFGGKIRFVVIQYPSWREMIDAGAGFDAIVKAAETQIRAQCQGHDCFLAGYSFGGFVAWETGCRLVQSGLPIRFLGLIDTRRAGHLTIEVAGWIGRVRRLIEALRLLPRETLTTALLVFLVHIRAFWVLRLMGEFAPKLKSRASFALRHHLITALRLVSLRRWELTSSPVPVTLFRSDEFDSELPDYGWGAKCGQVTVIPVNGTHDSLLTQPDLLRQRFLEAVDKAALTTPICIPPCVEKSEMRSLELHLS